MATTAELANGSISRTSAIHLQMYINGRWVNSESEKTFEAINPATGQVIATLPEGSREDAQRAIQAANAAKPVISSMSAWERAALCSRIADEMESRCEHLARVLTQDQGKPYWTEAQGEVNAAIAGFREASEHIKWLETSVIPVETKGKLVFTIRQPRGVYAVVTPWNFPLNIPIEYLAPGIATGNTIVWVPAPTTSVVAVALMECLEAAGVPPGVVNLVTGPGPVVGDEIVSHPGTDGVGFTGSSATGDLIARRAAGKPMLLELGGNGPTIVLDDADLDLAVPAIAAGCFWAAGQVCSATERILVHERVHDEFLARISEAANQFRLGDPFDKGTTLGPLNNEPTALKMDRHIEDALMHGARLVLGGERAAGFPTRLYYQPTVIDAVPENSLLNREETFGPIAPLLTFSDDDEALRLTNNNALGLTAAVFTEDFRKGMWFAERIATGLVNINENGNYWELHIPFGGGTGKRSGIGRLGGKQTLMEMTALKSISVDIKRKG